MSVTFSGFSLPQLWKSVDGNRGSHPKLGLELLCVEGKVRMLRYPIEGRPLIAKKNLITKLGSLTAKLVRLRNLSVDDGNCAFQHFQHRRHPGQKS